MITVHAPKKHTVVFGWSREQTQEAGTPCRVFKTSPQKLKKVGFRHATNTGGLAVRKKHSLQS